MRSKQVLVGSALLALAVTIAAVSSDSWWGWLMAAFAGAGWVLGQWYEQEKTAEEGPVKPFKGELGVYGYVAPPRPYPGFPPPLSEKAVAEDEWDCLDNEPLDDQMRNYGDRQ